MKSIFTILTLFILLLSPAYSQQGQCGSYVEIVKHLSESYKEVPTAAGVTANNTFMQIFVNSETGTWTIAVTSKDGMTCLVSAGENFRAIKEE